MGSTPTSDTLASVAGLVVGVGCSLGCPDDELAELVEACLHGLDDTVAVVATIDRRAQEPCVVALAHGLAVPLVTHPAHALAPVPVPTPSAAVAGHVGTPSVAEAAALLVAGPAGRLLVAKRRSPRATCAVAAVHHHPEPVA